MAVNFQAGLREVLAVNSAICAVDGEAGKLRYRGYDIADLAVGASYEEVTYLLWFGELPRQADLVRFRSELAARRSLPDSVLNGMRAFPRAAHPLEALRTALSTLVMCDPDARDDSPGANLRKSVRLTAQMAPLVAAWARIRAGRPVVSPDPSKSHAANFLFMLSGTPPDPASEEAMDAVLVLHAEHELNSSAFTARLVTATVADLSSGVISAIGALKGPRHGGANEDVLAMLEEIGAPERAAPYIGAHLEARARMSKTERAYPRNRIPGWGHPVYRVHDPRAAQLRAIGHRVAERTVPPRSPMSPKSSIA